MLSLVVLTGASAAGKTTVARCVETQPANHQVHFLDSIGVPSIEQMREAHGLEQTTPSRRGRCDGSKLPHFAQH
jgi:dephospho-CoA kinase